MNPAVKCAADYAAMRGYKPWLVYDGLRGLIDDKIVESTPHLLSGILHRGGTFLRSSRSQRFFDIEYRRQAYENLSQRTGIDGVKAVCTALIQAERYGTPLAQALRVLGQEIRDMRMSEAEKKAAALPPKLTVPMIVFFLPVLFVVILGPAIIQVFKYQ